MNKQSKPFVFKSFIIMAVCFLAFSNVIANDNQTYSVVTENLTMKLRNDLAKEDVSVKLNNIQQYKISKNQVEIKGEGICVLTGENNQMPLRFNATIDTVNQTVSDIEYDFVEYAPTYALSSNEEILMRHLMKQISKDYKTQNIVIAIDGYEDVSKLTDRNEFTGVGEVRIGDLVWNKIKFDIVLNPETKQASKIVYNVEK